MAWRLLLCQIIGISVAFGMLENEGLSMTNQLMLGGVEAHSEPPGACGTDKCARRVALQRSKVPCILMTKPTGWTYSIALQVSS